METDGVETVHKVEKGEFSMTTRNKSNVRQSEGTSRKKTGDPFKDRQDTERGRRSKRGKGFRRGVFSEDDLEIDPWDFDPELEELNFD